MALKAILLVCLLTLSASASPLRSNLLHAPTDPVYPSRENNVALFPGTVATASSWSNAFGGFPPSSVIDGIALARIAR